MREYEQHDPEAWTEDFLALHVHQISVEGLSAAKHIHSQRTETQHCSTRRKTTHATGYNANHFKYIKLQTFCIYSIVLPDVFGFVYSVFFLAGYD